MEKTMSLQSLLLSQDPIVLGTLPLILKDAGISVEVHGTPDHLPGAMDEQKVDTIFVDFESPSAAEFIRLARNHKKGAVLAIALTSDPTSTRKAFQAGATLAMAKPLSRERVLSGVRVTRSLMVHGRRRLMRIPLQAAISFTPAGQKPLRGIGLNINQGGVGFRMEQPPKVGQHGELRFKLPGSGLEVVTAGEVRWVNPEKKCGGFRFTKVFGRNHLEAWIADRCDQALGGSSDTRVTYRQ
jgi:CheY-like chemotaxis protein